MIKQRNLRTLNNNLFENSQDMLPEGKIAERSDMLSKGIDLTKLGFKIEEKKYSVGDVVCTSL